MSEYRFRDVTTLADHRRTHICPTDATCHSSTSYECYYLFRRWIYQHIIQQAPPRTLPSRNDEGGITYLAPMVPRSRFAGENNELSAHSTQHDYTATSPWTLALCSSTVLLTNQSYRQYSNTAICNYASGRGCYRSGLPFCSFIIARRQT